MKGFLSIILGLFLLLQARASELEISLLTCTQGDAVYAAFGHSALRIKNPKLGSDVVYNFGVFDFDTPYFYLKFVEGELNYELAIQQTEDFLAVYKAEDRAVYAQVIDLPHSQKIAIENQLRAIYNSDKKYYRYSFLHKNCASQIRDILQQYYPLQAESNNISTETTSYRTHLNDILYNKKWLKAGINILGGKQFDTEASAFKSAFLPCQLTELIRSTDISNGSIEPIVEQQGHATDSGWEDYFPSPFNSFLILFVITLLLKSINLERILFVLAGLIGVLLLNVMLITSHEELLYNFNILVFNPLFLAAACLSFFKNNGVSKMIAYFLQFSMVLACIMWIVGIQKFSLELFPLYLILLTCTTRYAWSNYKSDTENVNPTEESALLI